MHSVPFLICPTCATGNLPGTPNCLGCTRLLRHVLPIVGWKALTPREPGDLCFSGSIYFQPDVVSGAAARPFRVMSSREVMASYRTYCLAQLGLCAGLPGLLLALPGLTVEQDLLLVSGLWLLWGLGPALALTRSRSAYGFHMAVIVLGLTTVLMPFAAILLYHWIRSERRGPRGVIERPEL